MRRKPVELGPARVISSNPPVIELPRGALADAWAVYYDHLANAWEAWSSSAIGLLLAAGELDAEVLLFKEGYDASAAADEHNVRQAHLFRVQQMMRGMAAESLLKALWLLAGQTFEGDGTYGRVPGVGDHDLVQLAQKVLPLHGLALRPVDRDNLDVLGTAIYGGRYPVQRTMSKDKPPRRPWSPAREMELDELFPRLMQPLQVAAARVQSGGSLNH